jgi:hypothetical protein
MSQLVKIAALLGTTEQEAKTFCKQVQKHFTGFLPTFSVIAAVLEKYPSATPRGVATTISPELVYYPELETAIRRDLGLPIQNDRPRRKKPKEQRHYRRLIKTIAALLPGDDEQSITSAKQLLLDVKSRCQQVNRLGNSRLVSIIRRSIKEDGIDIDQVVSEVKREVCGYSDAPDLIDAVAELIPDEDRGDREKARTFLASLEIMYPKSKRLSNDRLLSAIRKACRGGSLNTEQAILEVRKEFYGYRGDPDKMSRISVPVGGKPE